MTDKYLNLSGKSNTQTFFKKWFYVSHYCEALAANVSSEDWHFFSISKIFMFFIISEMISVPTDQQNHLEIPLNAHEWSGVTQNQNQHYRIRFQWRLGRSSGGGTQSQCWTKHDKRWMFPGDVVSCKQLLRIHGINDIDDRWQKKNVLPWGPN